MSDANSPNSGISQYYIGLSITILYVVFLALLFIGFSAYITRTTIDSSGIEDKLIDELIYTNEQDLQLDRRIAQLNEKIAVTQARLDKIPISLMLAERELVFENNRINGVIGDKFSQLIDAINIQADSNLRNFFKSELQDSENIDSSEFIFFTKIRSHLTTFRLRSYSPDEDKETALRIVSELNDALAEYSSNFAKLELEYQQVLYDQTRMEFDMEAADAELEKLEVINTTYHDIVTTRHKSIISSLELPADVLLRFVKMPTIILTLVVTIAAGGLGSLAAFTRRFVRQDATAISSRLFANVAEGIVASIAIFLFAGTGMLMLTQGGAGQEKGVELSPYMVAFIAFLSGFMAENAFAKIEESGQKFFKAADPNGNGNGDANEGAGDGKRPQSSAKPDNPES
ncbi:MAG: hypothetical protein ABJQ71_10770 [Roseibium sp.]